MSFKLLYDVYFQDFYRLENWKKLGNLCGQGKSGKILDLGSCGLQISVIFCV